MTAVPDNNEGGWHWDHVIPAVRSAVQLEIAEAPSASWRRVAKFTRHVNSVNFALLYMKIAGLGSSPIAQRYFDTSVYRTT